MKKIFYLFLIIFVLTISSFLLLNKTKANSLGEGYLFFERMQVSTATGMTAMFTPGSNFSASENIFLKIIFPEATAGTWCKVNASTLTISGTTVSPVNQGSWSIDSALPGTLVATCYQGSGGSTDYIEVTGITALTSGTSYGFSISANGTNFVTGANTGSNLISFQLIEGTKTESTSFSVNLLTGDQVVVSAEVSAADTITCSLSTNTVNLGTLYKGGAYITAPLSLTTDSTSGFYWGVYGLGNGSQSGLYNSTGGGYILPSLGVDGQVDLLTGEGFGMLASSSEGYVPIKYTLATSGIFGSIGFGVENASVFLYADAPSSVVNTSLTLGGRAGGSALEGAYLETITYVCGGYIGATGETESIEASAMPNLIPSVIAYWHQNDTVLPNGGSGYLADPDVFPQSADFGLGEITVGGGAFNATTTSAGGDTIYSNVVSLAGTSGNAMDGVVSGTAITFRGGEENSGGYLEFSFSMLNRFNLEVSYDARGSGTAFPTHTWEYSTNGSDWNQLEIFEGRNNNIWETLELESTNSLDNIETAFLRVVFSGVSSDAGTSRIDNIKFIASEYE